MTPESTEADVAQELGYLLTPGAVRERAEALYALCAAGRLEHWSLDESRVPEVVARVTRVTRAAYPDAAAIPYHSRWRHFSAGGVDRVARFEARIRGAPSDTALAARLELAITSVLLDAGAGPRWSYRDEDGRTYSRSEGLAVASYHWFCEGGFSSEPARHPLSADAVALAAVDAAAVSRAFQVDARNPLVGVEGRALVLRRLGAIVGGAPEYFGRVNPRLGNLGDYLAGLSEGGALPAEKVLGAVLRALGPIWPGRESLGGTNLGDVWNHSAVGRVPFHKLSQWLTYSLCEPLEASGIEVTGLARLTGLAEYRNGGLFVDSGVLVPKHSGVLEGVHAVSSDLVVEWRALTVALLDRVAEGVRSSFGMSADDLPLAKVLEGGTWRAGREIAAEKRPSGEPPLQVESDGTVF